MHGIQDLIGVTVSFGTQITWMIRRVSFFCVTYNPDKKCVGPDSNRRTPARRDPKSRSFNLTRIPTPCKQHFPFFIREVKSTTLNVHGYARVCDILVR